MLTRDQRRNVWILIAAVLVLSAVLSEVLRPGHSEYVRAGLAISEEEWRDEANTKGVGAGTTFQTLMPTLLGVREVLASLMWVRADDYFHRGEYRPIISLVRQITAIDPHQLDVFATGAWHMAYNFMDKRLIQDGVLFLEDGCKKNNSVYDLYFELGYMHYDKTKDFPKAVVAYRDASERGTTQGKTVPPSYVRHQLAHALEKMGDIDQCLQQWQHNLEIARKLEAEGQRPGMPAGPNTSAARHNLYITARRRNERLAAIAERARNAPEAIRLWERNRELAEEWLREFPRHESVGKDLANAGNTLDRLRAGRLLPLTPTNLDFKFTVERVAPRRLRVSGTLNCLDLSRVHVRIADKDYDERIQRGFDFKMENCTLEYDNVSVRKGRFDHVLDLNRDPADMERKPEEIYPLKAEEYVVTVAYNPRLQAAFIQDRYGWNGEGLTAAAPHLKTDDSRAGVIDGKRYPLRTVVNAVPVKREDILAPGKKVLYTQ
jgi:tetratricopeptide (TPR) repeat protein